MIGSGYRSTSRLAASPPEVMLDILATNRLAVLEAVRRLRAELDALAELLADPQAEDGLRGRLEEINQRQASLLQIPLLRST
jgi:prephenate dehydrogenase